MTEGEKGDDRDRKREERNKGRRTTRRDSEYSSMRIQPLIRNGGKRDSSSFPLSPQFPTLPKLNVFHPAQALLIRYSGVMKMFCN